MSASYFVYYRLYLINGAIACYLLSKIAHMAAHGCELNIGLSINKKYIGFTLKLF